MADLTGVAGIILAAGASSRMGQAKQLLKWQGKTLLQHTIETAQQSALSPLVVVLGARASQIQAHLVNCQAEIILNEKWESGMGSTIAAGLKYALQLRPELEGACFLLTDQPYLRPPIITEMLRQFRRTGAVGVAARYKDTLGVPALFHQQLFTELLALDGQRGAQPLLRKYAREIESISFPKGAIDMDYPEDWNAFLKGFD
jgi:molybdenum cofactor cytidylyltransferase